MGKTIMAVLLAVFALLLLSCSAEPTETADAPSEGINITDENYCETVNLIHTDYEEYLGKTVTLEGVYSVYYDESNGNTYNYIFRSGPGCCAYDGDVCGFEFVYDGELPNEGDWIEVSGVIDAHEEENGGELLLYLNIRAESVVSQGKAEDGAVKIDHPQKEKSAE